ncbi:DEAD/DEAH box helicase [Cytobacillus purgationiresistens]|uniref:SNF2 family DNA or RNA helicase n=1 Tax=Cytobacillus purgationiresistens TaxID=863449 RepID=A0ABU0AM39_9BACI|nr:DEAD/DEAH box helicase [Cytobacillus purgationiresistens]MDQ0272326.1 SNF2 family DNA or RNA helicase [Cytobacillus purgationiresistens]
MNIHLSQNIIMERCGAVSYKRGEAFYRSKKVIFQAFESDKCEAVVTGSEDFSVLIKEDGTGDFESSCSCPTLASFQKDCQHVAAVLITILKNQRKGNERPTGQHPADQTGITGEIISIFSEKEKRSSFEQHHFENRKILEANVTCELRPNSVEDHLFSLKMNVGVHRVKDIRSFLQAIHHNQPFRLSNDFIYDSKRHCFRKNTDQLMQSLYEMINDERTEEKVIDRTEDSLLVLPTSWNRIYPLLESIENVEFQYEAKQFGRLKVKKSQLPITFLFEKDSADGFNFKIRGMQTLILLEKYQLVFIEGELYELVENDYNRLKELKRMVEKMGAEEIPIPSEQIGFFLEKVVPGLRQLGEVHISKEISVQFVKSPLKAKFYLDRLSHRLLASLEFHYGNHVMNPAKENEGHSKVMVFRDLEKEAAILELMEEGSFTKTDEGYFLHNEELEYQFLYHILPKLQKLVQVYATTAIRNRIFKENPKPKISVRIKKERTNWLEFKFNIAGIPEQEIRDVLVALDEKRRYYRLRNGTLFSLEAREFAEIQRFLEAAPIQQEDLSAWMDVPLIRGIQQLNQASESVLEFESSFREFLQALYHPGKQLFPLPNELEHTLRNYQKEGFNWMKMIAHHRFGGVLADDMGLGKTLQAIAFILSEVNEIRESKQPALIVCPSSVTYNWISEFLQFAPDIQAVIMDGRKDQRSLLQQEVKNVDVMITSYPLLRKDIKWYERQTFHTIIFDEAQSFKNPITETAKAVKKLKAGTRFALTGTPIENSQEELWSIFHVVFPELFLGLKEFSQLSRQKISRIVRPFMLRRMKADVLSEFPKKIESIELVNLLPEQKKLYAAYLAKLRHDTLKHLNKQTLKKNRIRILAGLTRLRQICCHPALFVDGYKGSSAKFEELLKILRESKLSGRRVLVFSQFTKMLDLIGKELANEGRSFFYLDGQTPAHERVEMCNRFNSGENDVFLISLKAGGTGLNLTGADTVILYDLWWNPAVEEQAADRAYRMGQKNDVQVIKLLSGGTIEEKIDELQDKKRALIEEIIDVDRQSTAALSEQDIKDILEIRS